MDNTPQMEFISPDNNMTIQEDITMLPEGEHKVSFNTDSGVVKTPVTVTRDLDKIHVLYSLGNKTYRSTLHPDGRVYSSVLIQPDEDSMSNPYEIQDKGIWRFTK
jgi:hypothetical protein